MATGDGLSQYERNEAIGKCAAHVHEVLHNRANIHGLTMPERLQAMLVVLQDLAFRMRDSDATTQ